MTGGKPLIDRKPSCIQSHLPDIPARQLESHVPAHFEQEHSESFEYEGFPRVSPGRPQGAGERARPSSLRCLIFSIHLSQTGSPTTRHRSTGLPQQGLPLVTTCSTSARRDRLLINPRETHRAICSLPGRTRDRGVAQAPAGSSTLARRF